MRPACSARKSRDALIMRTTGLHNAKQIQQYDDREGDT
jgi:hypothetical protein